MTRSLLICFWMAAWSLSVLPSYSAALSRYGCPSVANRILNSAAIVLGRTIHEERVETRPNMFTVTLTFRVEEVLKGDFYKPDEIIIEKYEPHQLMNYGASLPSSEAGSHFLFMHRNENGKPYSSCPLSAEEMNTVRMKRLIALGEDPVKHLESDDREEVELILACIEREFCRFGERRPASDRSPERTNERDRVVAYLQKQVVQEDKNLSSTALRILAYFDPPVPEAFDIFERALNSRSAAKIVTGATGLDRIGDPRAIPILLDRLTRYRSEDLVYRSRVLNGEVVDTEEDATELMGPRGGDPQYQLLRALFRFDDPRVTEFAMSEADNLNNNVVISKLAELGDERAVDALLRRVWDGDWEATSGLKKLANPRIVEQATKRMYDHPRAPDILAERGDAGSREFMLRLIRQGNRTGASWASVTRDPLAKADLIRGLTYAPGPHSFFQQEAAHALGRLRAFDLIPTTMDANGIDAITWQASFLAGLADLSIHGGNHCPPGEIWNCMRTSLNEVAKREEWADVDCDRVDRLFETVSEPRPGSAHTDLYHPWTAPTDLSDMPDPLDETATRDYFERNLAKCRMALRNGSSSDRFKIMQAALHCHAPVLDGELALVLFHDPDRMVRGRASMSVTSDNLSLTGAEVERWAFFGDGDATSMALNYISRHPKPEYAPIVVRILHQGWHLFDPRLFAAIIETKAVEAADLLRAYLENEHIVLRANAAVTLTHLQDRAGAAVLPSLLEKVRRSGGLVNNDYMEKALAMVEASEVSGSTSNQ